MRREAEQNEALPFLIAGGPIIFVGFAVGASAQSSPITPAAPVAGTPSGGPDLHCTECGDKLDAERRCSRCIS
jgi:hypothetical protein